MDYFTWFFMKWKYSYSIYTFGTQITKLGLLYHDRANLLKSRDAKLEVVKEFAVVAEENDGSVAVKVHSVLWLLFI